MKTQGCKGVKEMFTCYFYSTPSLTFSNVFLAVLCDLGDELHRARKVWDIGKTCPCKSFVSSQDNESGSKITELSKVEMNTDNKEEHQNESNDSCAGKEEASEASVKTEAASNSANQNPNAMDSESSFEGSDDVNLICDESLGVDSPSNHEQEWLTEEKRRNLFTKKAGFGLVEAKPPRDKGISAGLSLLMDYNSSTEPSPNESPANSDVKSKTGAFNFSFSSGLDLLVLACEEKEGLPMPNNDSMHRENKKLAEKSKPDPLGIQKDEEIKNGNYVDHGNKCCVFLLSVDYVRPAIKSRVQRNLKYVQKWCPDRKVRKVFQLISFASKDIKIYKS